MQMKSNRHILWVDDEIHHLKPHILYLETKGYSVSTATNGHDAAILNENNKYDLILLEKNRIFYPRELVFGHSSYQCILG